MADHGRVPVFLREFNGVERLGERADLVDFDENRIGHALLDAFAQELHVGDEQIVADELDPVAELVRELLPVGPVALRAAVFNAGDGILAAEFAVEVHQLPPVSLRPVLFLKT